MKKFNPLSLVRKYQILIIAASVLAGVASYFVFIQKQTYIASAIIQYTNQGAEEGKAPDGTEIDTSEIYSAEVMREVFSRMGLSYNNYNLDSFRSQVRVEPVLTEEEQTIQSAKNEKGEESETKPTKYMVSFTLRHQDAKNPQVFARQVLDNMLDVFLEKYGEKHGGSITIVNGISDIDKSQYDYLEMIELIETSVQNTQETLASFTQSNNRFRSTETGYSFDDFDREFSALLSNEIPHTYAYILSNRVSKDTEVLLSKYHKRIKNYEINIGSNKKKIEDIEEIIDSYINMMRESGNTDIRSDYILSQVYDDNGAVSAENSGSAYGGTSDKAVEYDVLLQNYASNRSDYENTLVDIAYCQYIIGIYGGEVPEISELLEVEEAAETSEAAEDSEASESSKAAEDSEASETSEAAEDGEASETSEVAETGEASESSEAAEDGEASEASEAAEDSEASESSEAAEGSEVSEASEAAEDGEVSETSEASEASEAARHTLLTASISDTVRVGEREGQETAEAMISELVAKLDALYEDLGETVREYREFAGAANIGLGSNVVVAANVQVVLYSFLVVVAFAVFLILAVIATGRGLQIFHYYLYIDKKLQIPNRAACDRYLIKREKEMLSPNFVCIALHFQQLRDKNRQYGREKCDAMMKKLVDILERVMPMSETVFKATNSFGEWVIFLDKTTLEQAEAAMEHIRNDVLTYNENAECAIEYTYDMAEAGREHIYQIRKLMVCAINRVKSETAASQAEGKNADVVWQTEEETGIITVETENAENQPEETGKEMEVEDLLARLERMKGK